MGTVLVDSIVNRASIQLHDIENERWTQAELLGWLNDAVRQIAIFRPDAYVVVGPIPLVSGTKQTLPAAGLVLIDITRNLGTSGLTPGPVVRLIEREELDLVNPDWHTDATSAVIQLYTYDQRSRKTFYVYPPSQDGVQVECHYGANPPNSTINGVNDQNTTSVLPVDDIYETPILEYMFYRAWLKDTDMRDERKAQLHLSTMLQMLGIKTKVDREFDPNKNAPPRTPARTGDTRGPAF